MSSRIDKGFYTIVGQETNSKYKILENVPNSKEESIEIAQTTPGKTQDGKNLTVFKTNQGRQFARLEEWPKSLLLEVTK